MSKTPVIILSHNLPEYINRLNDSLTELYGQPVLQTFFFQFFLAPEVFIPILASHFKSKKNARGKKNKIGLH
jgi:hypothetical protein